MWRLWALCWLYMDIWSHSLAVVGASPRVASPASGGPGGRVPIPLMLSVWIGFSSSICWKAQYDDINVICTGWSSWWSDSSVWSSQMWIVPGWWATIMGTYYQSRMLENIKSFRTFRSTWTCFFVQISLGKYDSFFN